MTLPRRTHRPKVEVVQGRRLEEEEKSQIGRPCERSEGEEICPKKKGKEMARMCVNFCHLSKSSANTIVVYFGVSTMDKLADFCEEYWKDTFIHWQKCHTCLNELEWALVLSLPQQDRIWCAE